MFDSLCQNLDVVAAGVKCRQFFATTIQRWNIFKISRFHSVRYVYVFFNMRQDVKALQGPNYIITVTTFAFGKLGL